MLVCYNYLSHGNVLQPFPFNTRCAFIRKIILVIVTLTTAALMLGRFLTGMGGASKSEVVERALWKKKHTHTNTNIEIR